MTSELKPFPITEFKTALSTYLQPWIRPQDAFDPLENAYVYRGTLVKRNGSTIFGNQLADAQPVMGIMQYQNESTGAVSLVVASMQYLYLYTAGATPDGGTFSKITSVSDSPFWSGTATGSLSIDTLWNGITPSSISITDGTTTITDDGAGNLSNGGIFAAGGTINYTTGVASLNFTGTTTGVTLEITLTLTGSTPIFTGNIKNFFNFTNWQPTTSATAISTSYLYMTNNVDPVTLFDGTNMARPGFYIDSAGTKQILKCLDVKTFNNRLLLIRPTVTAEANAANQDIYFSALFNPFDFVSDVAGKGGFISAATGDQLISEKFLRDILIVAFSNSSWTFQSTGLTTPPFVFRRINNSKNISCPYAAVAYDERITNLGNTGFVACDGVNVQRFDIPIVDFYETEIAQRYFNQCFSLRYDNLNQTWMFYCSNGADSADFPVVGGIAPGADKVLIYNFFENTWATYQNTFPMTCMGLFYVTSGTTWAELNVTNNDEWENTDAPWFSYGTQSTAPLLLGGDTSGNIYHLDNPLAVRDAEGISADEFLTLGDGGTNYSGTIKFIPVIAGTFTATDGTESFADDGAGVLTGSAGGSGTIDYTTGAWTLNFNAIVSSSTTISATYQTYGASFNLNITTTRWNPFIGAGQKTQFAYIDIYYAISSVDAENPIQLTLLFSVDNSEGYVLSRTLTLDGPVSSSYAWKRIYVNLIGEFIQMHIDPSEDSRIEILGFVLWAREAGRLTP